MRRVPRGPIAVTGITDKSRITDGVMKFWKHSLMFRLVGRFSLVSIAAVFGVGAIAFLRAKSTLETSTLERLEVTATLKEQALERWIRNQREGTMALAALPELRAPASILHVAEESSPEFRAASAQIQQILRAVLATRADWVQVAILSVREGKIWVSTDFPRQGEYRNREPYFIQGRQETFVQNPYLSWGTNQPTMTVATPLRNTKGESIAVLVVDLDLTPLDEIVSDRTGLGNSGQAYLVDRSRNIVQSEGFAPSNLSHNAIAPGIEAALAGGEGSGFYLDRTGIPTLGAYRWVEAPELALLVEVPRREVLAPLRQLSRTVWLVGLGWAGFLVVGAFLLARSIARPILAITKVVTQVADGDWTPVASVLAEDEVGLLARNFNRMTERVRHLHTGLEDKVSQLAHAKERIESLNAELEDENTDLMAELRSANARLEQFLQAVPVGIVAIDTHRQVSYINHSAQQLLGTDVVPGLSIDTLLAPDRNTLCVARTRRLYPIGQLPLLQALDGYCTTVEDLEIHQGDRIVPVEAWGRPIYDDLGNIIYAIAAFQNITARQEVEAQRQKFTDEMFQLSQAASRFVPDRFLHLLEKRSIVDVTLGDSVQKEMSILFSDIRDFTTLSEVMTPAQNFRFINSYLSSMEPIITENYGFIDKYIADAIMALFNRSANDALRAAIAMLEKLKVYNKNRMKSGYKPIAIGMGINTGSLMLGTVGGHQRMDGTAIGDAVNLASRLESLTKNYGVSLLISNHTFFQIDDVTQYSFRAVDRVRVKGKSERVSVFEVFDADPPKLRDGKLKTKILFEEALLLYNKGMFAEAEIRFSECLQQNPEDTVAQIYARRCQEKR